MPRKPLSLRLQVFMALLVGVVTFVARGPALPIEELATQVDRIADAEVTAPPVRAPERLDLLALEARAVPPLSPTLFGNVTAVPQIPVATPTPPPVPPPLPKRVAPPLPYVYLGQYRDADGTVVLYLRRDDSVIVARPGTQLDEAYRLEAEIDGGLTFTYLPLNEAQIVPIRNPAL